jgi:hypothetical protein
VFQTYRHVCDLLKEDGLEDAGGRLVGMTELRFRGQRVRARAQKETKNADAGDRCFSKQGQRMKKSSPDVWSAMATARDAEQRSVGRTAMGELICPPCQDIPQRGKERPMTLFLKSTCLDQEVPRPRGPAGSCH